MGKGLIEGCGANCAKYILFFFNLIFFIAGAGLLGVGIWMKVDKNFDRYLEIIRDGGNDKVLSAAIIMVIAIGAFIFLVGFLGCCGACTESSCMLFLYATLMILLLIAEIVAAILVIVFRKELGNKLKENMIKQTQKLKPIEDTGNTGLGLAWNFLQHSLKCCGGEKYYEYKYNKNFTTTRPVPSTCCRGIKNAFDKPEDTTQNEIKQCFDEFKVKSQTNDTNTQYVYSEGCYPSLKKWIEDKSIILIGIGFGVVFIQILGIIFACCVRNAISKKATMA